MPTAIMAASAPPPMATSQRPVATSRAAAAMAWVPAAQAVAIVSHGPCQPARMETWAAPALAIIIGTRKGETRRAPFSWNTPICSSSVSRPPTPVPKMTPERSGSAPRSPASASAMSAAATENWANRSTRRTSFGPNQADGSKSRHPALARRAPGRCRPSQKASRPMPQHGHDAHAR